MQAGDDNASDIAGRRGVAGVIENFHHHGLALEVEQPALGALQRDIADFLRAIDIDN